MHKSHKTGRSILTNMLIFFGLLIAINVTGYATYLYLDKKYNQTLYELNDDFSQKSLLMQDIQMQMGYGQFIHNFKNLVIRGDNQSQTTLYKQAVENGAERIHQKIAEYRQFPSLNQVESTGLNQVESVIMEYTSKAQQAIELRASNESIQAIDSKITVNDQDTMYSLQEWSAYLNGEWKQQSVLLANSASKELHATLIAILIGSFITILMGFELLVRRTLILPLNKINGELKSVFSNSASLNPNFKISQLGANEIRQLGQQFSRLFNYFEHQINELTTIRHTVDQSSANIMLADSELNITYMNESILTTLKSVESEIQLMLPHFSAHDLIGKNIDIFHVHPEHQRNLLSELKETYVAKLTLGELHLDIIVNPIWNKDGKRCGFVTEWKDITESVQLEKMQKSVEDNLKVIVERATKGYTGEQIDVSGLDGFIHDLGVQINSMSMAIHNANKIGRASCRERV